ncbi:MAG: hypothetical protein A3B23_00250 [Candidatus Colwellbacteria bacterium RIFCSPLOWO2_01_FULL_48_10]|uniref:Uncharacterized protein n=1 Tax=Candidatus Colwellbacteria bacterium RIFCSPLOWO2_01_FULL_48_10 TaxID=1797690 RepID=A0A1G1Z7A9_9BACT|nr:MAG: hypothetical protein A3B23_00250 [Candidatus Colwellbacteria bacterium RIFCSPLOWO2_01_FULL_48_10]
MKTSGKELTRRQRQKALEILLREIAAVKTGMNLGRLLDLLLTYHEKEAILRRLTIGNMLKHKNTYRAIGKALGVSAITISKVRDILEARGYGRNPQRKRIYSRDKDTEDRPLLGYYKGARSIV